MFIKQADLFWGLNKGFVKKIMDIAHKEAHETGAHLFREGDTADRFYMMLKGRVRLIISPSGLHVHIVAHAGETFGWSGLVSRDHYSSTAECVEKTLLMKFECKEIVALCESDPVNGMDFYKRLAGTLGHRLINSYQTDHIHTEHDPSRSFGSGQMIDSEFST